MTLLISFISSVMAKIVAYYICKWLDSKENGNKPQSDQLQ